MDNDLSSLRAVLVCRRQQLDEFLQAALDPDEVLAARVSINTLCTVILDIDRMIAAAQPLSDAA